MSGLFSAFLWALIPAAAYCTTGITEEANLSIDTLEGNPVALLKSSWFSITLPCLEDEDSSQEICEFRSPFVIDTGEIITNANVWDKKCAVRDLCKSAGTMRFNVIFADSTPDFNVAAELGGAKSAEGQMKDDANDAAEVTDMPAAATLSIDTQQKEPVVLLKSSWFSMTLPCSKQEDSSLEGCKFLDLQFVQKGGKSKVVTVQDQKCAVRNLCNFAGTKHFEVKYESTGTIVIKVAAKFSGAKSTEEKRKDDATKTTQITDERKQGMQIAPALKESNGVDTPPDASTDIAKSVGAAGKIPAEDQSQDDATGSTKVPLPNTDEKSAEEQQEDDAAGSTGSTEAPATNPNGKSAEEQEKDDTTEAAKITEKPVLKRGEDAEQIKTKQGMEIAPALNESNGTDTPTDDNINIAKLEAKCDGKCGGKCEEQTKDVAATAATLSIDTRGGVPLVLLKSSRFSITLPCSTKEVQGQDCEFGDVEFVGKGETKVNVQDKKCAVRDLCNFADTKGFEVTFPDIGHVMKVDAKFGGAKSAEEKTKDDAAGLKKRPGAAESTGKLGGSSDGKSGGVSTQSDTNTVDGRSTRGAKRE